MRKYLKFTILTLVAVAVLWWFGRDLDWVGVRAALGRSDWRFIAAAVAVVSAIYVMRAFRWRAFLAPLAEGVSLRELFAATTVGFGAVFLLGRAGEVVRPAFLSLRERRVSAGASFVTIGVERIYDMSAIVLMFAANLLVFRAPGGGDAAAYARVRAGGFILLLLAVGGIVALILFRRYADTVIGALERLFGRGEGILARAGKILTGILAQLARSLSVLTDARALLVTVGWTALIWLAILAANALVLRAFGLRLGISATIFMLGWSLVGSLVPTPGGAAGTYHLATAYGLMFLGVSETEAKATAIVLHLVVFSPAVFFGLYYFLRSDVSLARLRNLASTEEAEDAEPKQERIHAAPVA
ncbi:MAG TPA: lysylphosphatidylglycerol synthase transmembrane domain-containing protein [Pyrinomonadaceae bacterium]